MSHTIDYKAEEEVPINPTGWANVMKSITPLISSEVHQKAADSEFGDSQRRKCRADQKSVECMNKIVDKFCKP